MGGRISAQYLSSKIPLLLGHDVCKIWALTLSPSLSNSNSDVISKYILDPLPPFFVWLLCVMFNLQDPHKPTIQNCGHNVNG